ncbi:MAG: aspartate aminotransferase family protein [Nitrospinota bacterium]
MKAPRLRVPHPGPETRVQLERLRGSEGRAGLSFGMSPDTVVVERALGASVEDVDGNIFLDFVSGFGSINAGHCHPRVVEAMREQAGKLHQAMSLGSRVRLDLEEKILSLVPGPVPKKILFGTSGSEAVETAIKLTRRATGRQEIVGFTGGFHGRTLGALPFMGRKAQREGLGTLVPGARHVPFPYPYRSPFGTEPEKCAEGTIAYIEEFLKNPVSGWGEVAAILIEPVQGNGGMIPAPLGFLGALRRLCDRYGVLLILDEVMSGFARTGKMFAYQHEEGVEPDLLVLGKSLSGGLPLSACVAKADIADASEPGTETGTYAGNVMACASGLASIAVYEEENLSERAAKMGDYFLERLGELAERHPIVGEVRGRGLMTAAELVSDRKTREPLSVAREASDLALKKGLFLYPGGHYRNVLAFMPPLLIGEEEIDTAVEIVDEVLIELAARN